MSNLEELEVKNVCSLSCDAPTNMCSLLGDHTCGDNSCTTSDRFVNWTATSETHQRKSNIFIIQQNKRNVKDRLFSRKIESEWSFFVSESHRIRWISE